MTTMTVLDADNIPVAIEKPLTPGRSAAATSRPVVLSTEDKAALDALATQTTAAAILAKLSADPATQTTLAASVVQETAINAVLGTTAGAAVTTSVAGTIQGYLRGIVSLLVSGITVATHAVTQSGTWNVTVNAAIAAGTNLLGRTAADASAATGGIMTTARMASAAASTNATNVKTSAGRIYAICGKNNAAYDVFLVLYDSAANPPVPGTTTIRKKIPCPAGQAFVYDFPLGLYFGTGIGYAFTKLVADADTTVLVAADVTAFNLDYV